MTAKHKNKQPRAKSVPTGEKVVRPYPGAKHRDIGDYLSWRFDLIYDEPDYGWSSVSSADRDLIHDSLRGFEKMTAAEIFAGGEPGKTYGNPGDIPNKTARDRFLDKYADEDEIHRLNCGGRCRLFGFRRGGVFLVLWWDPNHEIWPAKKKHT